MKNAPKDCNQTKSSEEDMDKDIWKELPEDLNESVLARLPLAALCRFRTVCRKWNAMPNSPSFAAKMEQKTHPWFWTFMPGSSGAVYDPSSKKWHHSLMPTWETAGRCLPMASAGGLICHINYAPHPILWVTNPLTRSLRQLPACSASIRNKRMSIGMTPTTSKSSSWGYKVIWVNCDGEYQVYDAANNSWSLPQKTPSYITVPLSLGWRSDAVWAGGTTLYFRLLGQDGVVSYDTSTGTWRQFLVPNPPGSYNHVLAECDGRILLVGKDDGGGGRGSSCVCIWELRRSKTTMSWEEVDRMPGELYAGCGCFGCVGNKGLLMLALMRVGTTEWVFVTYDPLSREWVRVPDCVPRHERGEVMSILRGVGFYPSLAASA